MKLSDKDHKRQIALHMAMEIRGMRTDPRNIVRDAKRFLRFLRSKP